MSMVSVNIPAMATLVKTMAAAAEAMPGRYATVRQLASSPVDLSPLSTAPQVASWLTDEVGPLRIKLAYARWLDASTPGVQNTVRFDENAIPHISEAEAKKLAERAKALMVKGRPPSKELLDLLKKYGGNPQFALFLMGGYRKGEGSAGMTLGPRPDLAYIASLPPGKASEKFLALYSRALGGLSQEFPPPKFWDRSDRSSGDPTTLRAWALLASRGNWSKEWLVGLGNGLIAAERDDPTMWTKKDWNSGDNINVHMHSIVVPKDPQGLPVQDPMVWLMNALSRNPEAAEAFLNGGGTAPVMTGGKKVDIPANLRFLALERPWNQDRGLSLAMALGAAKSLPDKGMDAHLEVLSHLDHVDKKSWGSFFGHLGLDIIGLIPVIGDWADVANMVWSLAEGDYPAAAASGLGAVPGAGTAATIAKWIKLINRAGEVAGHVLTVAELKQLLEETGLTNQAPGQAPQPVPEDATYLGPTDDREWYDGLRLESRRTYVLDSGVILRTGDDGRITEVTGDVSDLDPASRKWIEEHRAKR